MKAERFICPVGAILLACGALLKVSAAFYYPHLAPKCMADALLFSFGAVAWSFLFLRLGKRKLTE